MLLHRYRFILVFAAWLPCVAALSNDEQHRPAVPAVPSAPMAESAIASPLLGSPVADAPDVPHSPAQVFSDSAPGYSPILPSNYAQGCGCGEELSIGCGEELSTGGVGNDGWNLSGWLDAGYTYNSTNPTSHFNGPYNAVDQDRLLFNQA